jgi:hypothetical protein
VRPERPARYTQQEPIIFTSPAGRVTRLNAGAWLRRITAVLVAVGGDVLACTAAVPAASTTG